MEILNVKKLYLAVLFLVFVFSGSACTSKHPAIENPVPPTVYVATDGSGNFNCDGKHDQDEINAALDFVAAHDEYTTVYLKGPNTFWIDEPIYISANTTLEGDESAVVKLVDYAGWHKRYKPLIGQKGTVFLVRPKTQIPMTGNITIRGFELDGNRANQNEPSGHGYYRMIQLQNAYNVTINDMYIHNGLADAIILVREPGIPRDINSRIYNNRIHNDGHDGIYIEYAENFEIYDNIITNTRTDASIRVQNCNNLKIYNNIAGNAPDRQMSGVAAVHVENRGDVPVDDIEIYGNFFYGNQTWHGIWLEREAKGTGSLNSHTGVYIHNNIISQYRLAGIGIYGFNNTKIENNLIEISTEGAGIAFYQGDPVNSSLSGFTTYVKNNIIVYNKTYGLDNQQPSVHTFVSNYNDIYGNESGEYHNASSSTDIYTDPLLASDYEYHGRYYNATSYYILSPVWADADDEQDGENPVCKTDLGAMKARAIYHLKSEAGRWDGEQWVTDAVTSPCLDAGAPESVYFNEPSPNGGRINLGAYGNTETTSKSNE